MNIDSNKPEKPQFQKLDAPRGQSPRQDSLIHFPEKMECAPTNEIDSGSQPQSNDAKNDGSPQIKIERMGTRLNEDYDHIYYDDQSDHTIRVKRRRNEESSQSGTQIESDYFIDNMNLEGGETNRSKSSMGQSQRWDHFSHEDDEEIESPDPLRREENKSEIGESGSGFGAIPGKSSNKGLNTLLVTQSPKKLSKKRGNKVNPAEDPKQNANKLQRKTLNNALRQIENLKDLARRSKFSKSSDTTAMNQSQAKLNAKAETKYAEEHKPETGQKKVRDAIIKRRIVRIIYFYTIVSAFVLAFFLTSTFIYDSEIFEYTSGQDFTMNIENCRLFIHEDNTIASDIVLSYRVPVINSVSHQVSGTTVNIQSNQDPSLCMMQFLTKSAAYLSSLKVTCTNYCSIVQDSSMLTIKNDLTISGDNQVFANFAQISTQNVYFTAIDGYIQLNNALLTGSASNLQLSRGDIVLQSTTDFATSFTVPNSSYCFSAPQLVSSTFAAACDQSGSITQANLLKQSTTTCTGSLQLCASTACSISFTVTAKTNLGNYYANLIPKIQEAVQSGYQVAQGAPYDFGIGFDPNLTATVQSFPNIVNNESNVNPGLIVDLGNFDSRSSKFTKWVISSNPSYAYMKPWWLSTFSASLLTTSTFEQAGFLYPGFCPWKPIYDQYNLYNIQQLYATNNISYLTTVIWDKDSTAPPYMYDSTSLHSGILSLSTSRTKYVGDYWYSFTLTDNGALQIKDNNVNNNIFVVLSIVLSLIISAYGSIVVTLLLIYAFRLIYHRAVTSANHAQRYAKLERASVDPSKHAENVPKTHNPNPRENFFMAFVRRTPSIAAIGDYLTILVIKLKTNSIRTFYDALFEVRDPKDFENDILDTLKFQMKGSELKLLYEKYCFLMHYQEKKLTDKSATDILETYGFKLEKREATPTEVLIRVTIRKEEKPYYAEDHEGRNSLEVFKELCLEITAFETDQLEVELTKAQYEEFCEANHLDKEIFSSDVLREKFGIESTLVALQFIRHIDENDDDEYKGEIREFKAGLANKIYRCVTNCRRKAKRNKEYVIGRQRIQNLFYLLTEQYDRISGDENDKKTAALAEATMFTILPSAWYLIDFLAVLLHVIAAGLLTVPSIFIAILNEVSYSKYSLKDPSSLITIQDWQDPFTIVKILLTNSSGWNIALFAISILYWGLMFIDLPFYYVHMEFPQEKAFLRGGRTFSIIGRLSRMLQWLIIFFSLLMYTGYACLVLIWLVLGAIINPTAFLPLASSAITFGVFVKTKYELFKKLKSEGMMAVMNEIDKLFGGKINNIMKSLSMKLSSVAKVAGGLSKNLVESPAFQSITGKVSELGLVDEETISKIKQKAELLSSQSDKIVTDATHFAAAAARDPLTVLKEIDGIADAMRTSAITKLEDESQKREIPKELVNTIIQMSLKDMNKLKPAVRSLLVYIVKKIPVQGSDSKDLEYEIADIVTELLFPDSINQKEFGTFMFSKIMEFFIKKMKLDEHNFDQTTFRQAIMALNHLRNSEGEKLGQLFPVFVEYLKKNNKPVNSVFLSHITWFSPLFEVLGIIISNGLEHAWKLRAPTFRFIYQVCGEEESVETIIDFLNLLLTRNELPWTWKELEENKIITPLAQKLICDRFADLLNLPPEAKPMLTFALHYLKQEGHELPAEAVNSLREVFLPDFNPTLKKIFPLAFKLANSIHVRPQDFVQRIDKCAQNLSMEKELAKFTKTMLKFLNRDSIQKGIFEELQNNGVLNQISANMKISSEVLIDLLHWIYYFVPTTNSRPLIELLMKRMDINTCHYHSIENVVTLYLSLSEEDILRVLNRLRLPNGKLLLVSKGLLNPYFLTLKGWKILLDRGDSAKEKSKASEEYNFTDSDEYDEYKTGVKVYNLGTSKWKEWIVSIEKRLSEGGLDAPSPDLALARTYFSIKEGMKITRNKIIEDIKALNNQDNNLIALTQAQFNKKYSPLDVICILASLNSLQLALDGTDRQKLEKDELRVITTLAQTLNITPDKMELFLQIPMLGEYAPILESFNYFLDHSSYDKTALKKFVEYTAAQMEFQDWQLDFICQEFPFYINVESQPELKFPEALLKKL